MKCNSDSPRNRTYIDERREIKNKKNTHESYEVHGQARNNKKKLTNWRKERT